MQDVIQAVRKALPARCAVAGLLWALAPGGLFCFSFLPGCRGATPVSEPGDAARTVEREETAEPAPTGGLPAPSHVAIGIEADEPDRWLFVEAVKKDAVGGWATGSFDAGRNKLDIRTHDVRAFAIDVGRIPIRWERLVILSINGLKSELCRRDYALLHFALDDHGQWVVIEP